MALQLKKATKEQSLARVAIHGPAGSGKTKSGLKIMTALLAILTPGKRIAVIDTERGSASKYADEFDFDVIEVFDDYHPDRLHEAIDLVVADGSYGGLIIDSFSHFWNGPGGILELVDKEAKRLGQNRGGKADSFSAWNLGDKYYRRVVQKKSGVPLHLISTMRAKQEYVRDERTNKVEKKGFAPETRTGTEYEYDVECAIDIQHVLTVGKTRCDALDGKDFTKPGRDFAQILATWLSSGAPRAESKPATQVAAPSNHGAQAPSSEPAANDDVDAHDVDTRVTKLLELYAKASEMVHVDAVRDMVMTQNGERAFSRDDRTKLAAARADAQDRIRAAAA